MFDIRHVKIPLYSAWVGATLGAFDTHCKVLLVQEHLTYRSSDNDLETITPNCFLKADPKCNVILRFDEDPIWERDPTSRDNLIDALSSRDEMLSHFKELWYDSYLLSLRETCKDLHQINWNNKISIDDIILVKLLNKSRPYWVVCLS